MSSEWILLIIGIVLTIGTGFFVASEFTLVNLDRADLEARQERGETMLGPVISGLKRTSTHLSSAQLGINVRIRAVCPAVTCEQSVRKSGSLLGGLGRPIISNSLRHRQGSERK